MKVFSFWVIFTLFFMQTSYSQYRNCGTMDVLDRQAKENPLILKNMEDIERQTLEFIKKNPNGKSQRAVITIPVVVHVVWNTAVPAQNISDAQIQSQIDVLNQDFSAANIEVNGSNFNSSTYPLGVFSGLVANSEVQFCLAQQNPSGGTTNGINRVASTVTSWGTTDNVKRTSQGGIDPWNPSFYLNIWVCNIGSGILGYAQFPGGAPATDGVVIDYRYFGNTGTATAPYHKGRTATHEVGHWLNLRHIWGDATCGNDLVSDTPVHNAANGGCQVYPHYSTCTGTPIEMTMNYMDYSFDACMYMFSPGQKARMQAVLNSGGARASLAASPGCMAPDPNACNAPTGLASSNITQSSATSSWTAVSGAVGYTFEYKTSAATTWTVQTVSGTSVNLSGLLASTTYNTRVRASCAVNTSVYSSTVNFTTSAPPPPCNDAFETNNTSSAAKSITINSTTGIGTLNAKIGTSTDTDWFKFKNTSSRRNIKVDLINLTANYDIKLFRKGNLNTPVGISQNTGTANEQIINNNTLSATDYFIQVYGINGAFDNNNCYNLTVTISGSSFRVDGSSFDDELLPVEDEFLLFPNPASNEVTMVVPFGKNAEGAISIFDISGKMMSSQKINGDRQTVTYNMDVSSWNPGMYIVHFTTGEKSYMQKLVIADRK